MIVFSVQTRQKVSTFIEENTMIHIKIIGENRAHLFLQHQLHSSSQIHLKRSSAITQNTKQSAVLERFCETQKKQAQFRVLTVSLDNIQAQFIIFATYYESHFPFCITWTC